MQFVVLGQSSNLEGVILNVFCSLINLLMADVRTEPPAKRRRRRRKRKQNSNKQDAETLDFTCTVLKPNLNSSPLTPDEPLTIPSALLGTCILSFVNIKILTIVSICSCIFGKSVFWGLKWWLVSNCNNLFLSGVFMGRNYMLIIVWRWKKMLNILVTIHSSLMAHT